MHELLFPLCIAYCGHPKLFTVSNDSLPIVEGYDDIVPAEGTTVMFSCPLGLVLSGPDSSTCEENGDWEPDPNGLICNVSSSEGEYKMDVCINCTTVRGCIKRHHSAFI